MPEPGHVFKSIVIGAGLGGISVAADLLRHGIDDFLVLESASDVGGVWRENVYPNCACDVPAQLYSFSFAPNSEWSSNFAPQAEILAYVRDVAQTAGVTDKVRFETVVESAAWREAEGVWEVGTRDGSTLRAEHLVAAVGQLNRPSIPALPGLDTFEGPVVHTANWDPDLDLAGKDVVVVGAGATAVQVVPYVVEHAQSTVSLIRTPCYVMPKPEELYDEDDKARFRAHPEQMAEIRAQLYDYWNKSAEAMARTDLDAIAAAEQACREHLEAHVADPQLRAALMPDYRFGCKRPVFSSNYYPALADPRCTVVRSGAAEVGPAELVTTDGQRLKADVLVLATGFMAGDLLGHVEIRGSDDRVLRDEWRDGPRAYMGTLVEGFPNFYVMYGPNTQPGGSVLGILEAQAAFVRRCVQLSDERSARIAVHEDAYERFNADLEEALERSVFVRGGCMSWYRVGGTGRVVVRWPGSLGEFERLVAGADPGDFVVASSTDPLEESHVSG